MASFFWLNDNEVSAPDCQKLTIFLCIAIKKSWGKNHGNFRERACFLLSRLSVANQPVDREGCGGEMFAMFSCHLNNCLVFRKNGHLWITSILVINCCWQTIPKHSGLKWQFSFSSSLTILLPGLGSAELFLCLSCWCHLPVSLLLVGSLAETLGWLSRSVCMGSSGLLLRGISPSGLTSRVRYPSHGSSELPTVESSSGQAFLRLKPGTVTASLLLPSIDESQSQAHPRFRKRGLQEGMEWRCGCGSLGVPREQTVRTSTMERQLLLAKETSC